jgi:hypothetical protein
MASKLYYEINEDFGKKRKEGYRIESILQWSSD